MNLTKEYLIQLYPFHINWTSKTINDLHKELLSNLCSINPITGERKVHIGFCQIQRPDGKWLQEISRIDITGKKLKNRNSPLAGRFCYNLSPMVEMKRKIKDELGYNSRTLMYEDKKRNLKLEQVFEVIKDTHCYPGITTTWSEYHYLWLMPGNLVKERYTYISNKNTTIFGWVDTKPKLM